VEKIFMSLISVRLADNLLNEVKIRAQALHMSKTEYIRKAIEHMNEEVLKQERKEKLMHASLKVRKESLLVNAQFSRIEYDPET
jgi:predicted transcriptional regulator